MSLLQLYLLFIALPAISNIASVIALIATVILIISVITCCINADNKRDEELKELERKCNSVAVYSFLVIVIFLMLSWLIPSKEQVYMLAGGYAATNDKEFKKLPDNVLKAANTYLENLQIKLDKPTK